MQGFGAYSNGIKCQRSESEIENCHQQLCLEEIYSNPEMTKKVTEEKNRLETELAEAFEKWEELHLMLEDQQDQ